jgi:glycine oxidase
VSDVVVVGGGAIGLACAWRLAQRGCAVEVIDPEPGGGASGVAAGMLAPMTEARMGEEDLLQLGLSSLSRWPGFVAELSASSGDHAGPLEEALSYRTDGTVMVALDADDRAALRDLVDRQRALGLEVDHLSAGEVRDREPGLAPAVRRGALVAGERSVDPAALVAGLLPAARAAGVRLRRDRVVRLLVDGGDPPGRTAGVELATGEQVAATTVVLAAGAWSARIEGLPDRVQVPVRPVKGQVVTLRQRPGDLVVGHTVRGYVRGSVIYLVPRNDGRVVCGATVEERGWDPIRTAGGAYELLRDVLALYPGLDEAELVGTQAGFRPGTPDDLPLIGRTAVDGLVLATGHYRNGILLAPITADAVAALVVGEAPPDEVAPADPRRFAERPAVPSSSRPERGHDREVAAP